MQGCQLQATSTSGSGSEGTGCCEHPAFREGSCGPGAGTKEGASGRAASQRTRGAPPAGVVQPGGSLAPLLPRPLQPGPTSSLTGIIDLSQVPHLPVLVPPTPGTPATAMDRLAYLPTAPQHFSSRLSSSPLSPGEAPTPVLGVLGQMPCSVCSTLEDKSRALPVSGAEPQAFGFPGGPTHLTKPTATSSSEREREREKSILASTTTVEHAPIWRPGRTAEPPARAPAVPVAARGPPL